MCVVVIHHDPEDPIAPLRVCETRDENVHRLHGHRALRHHWGCDEPSFGEHWRHAERLEGLWIAHPSPSPILDAGLIGGYDENRGTWLAISQRTGVYVRLLIALFDDGEFGENRTPEIRRRREQAGYAKRGALCLAAASFDSARDAADKMPKLVATALRRSDKRLLPCYLIVADARDANVLHLEPSGRMRVVPIPRARTTMISIRGIDAETSVMTRRLLPALRDAELPDPRRSDGWDDWLRVQSIQAAFGEDWARPGAVSYGDPAWRSHQHSIIQPPYLNMPGDRQHARPAARRPRDGEVVEWTASSTCYAITRDTGRSLLVSERHLAVGEALPSLAAGGFPERTADYRAVATA